MNETYDLSQANYEKLSIHVQTFDQTQRANVVLPPTTLVADLVKQCRENFGLPTSVDYAIRDAAQNKQLKSQQSLADAGVIANTVLEVFPLHEAGGRPQ